MASTIVQYCDSDLSEDDELEQKVSSNQPRLPEERQRETESPETPAQLIDARPAPPDDELGEQQSTELCLLKPASQSTTGDDGQVEEIESQSRETTRRPVLKIDQSLLPDTLREQLSTMSTFYTKKTNMERGTPAVGESTMTKVHERLLCKHLHRLRLL